MDAHNLVPVWEASSKQEHAARTIRPKINSKLQEFLTEFPTLSPTTSSKLSWINNQLEQGKKNILAEIIIIIFIFNLGVNWNLALEILEKQQNVPEVSWILPGEAQAEISLEDFIQKRLPKYGSSRNDPTQNAQSNLSPYLHFGQISAQHIALKVSEKKQEHKESVGKSGPRPSISYIFRRPFRRTYSAQGTG